eukprot:TRINITY_DN24764_c0_g1_i1.p1 TRINITY_DN24764_c0_g1~~TRINITY_DN24764_c0_g1_i1.p1  ORF type:complete len:211 (-),score=37.91 TRINITY_DN24764_c0_g1_i1:232-864(-)
MKAENSPNLTMIAVRVNLVTRWVTTEILTTNSLKKRIKVISLFIILLKKLLALHNFHGFMTISLALSQDLLCCGDTKEAWNRLHLRDVRNWAKVQKLLSPYGNFRCLRETVANAQPPMIPTPILFLKDLNGIEEGNPNLLPDTKFPQQMLLNLEKLCMVGDILVSLRRNQQQPYDLDPTPLSLCYLMNLSPCDNDELQKMSTRSIFSLES